MISSILKPCQRQVIEIKSFRFPLPQKRCHKLNLLHLFARWGWKCSEMRRTSIGVSWYHFSSRASATDWDRMALFRRIFRRVSHAWLLEYNSIKPKQASISFIMSSLFWISTSLCCWDEMFIDTYSFLPTPTSTSTSSPQSECSSTTIRASRRKRPGFIRESLPEPTTLGKNSPCFSFCLHLFFVQRLTCAIVVHIRSASVVRLYRHSKRIEYCCLLFYRSVLILSLSLLLYACF